MTTTAADMRVGRCAGINKPYWIFSRSFMPWVGLPKHGWRKRNPDVIQGPDGEQTIRNADPKVTDSVHDKMWQQGFVALALV